MFPQRRVGAEDHGGYEGDGRWRPVSRDGNGNQSDFALIGAAQTDDRSARTVIPSGLDGPCQRGERVFIQQTDAHDRLRRQGCRGGGEDHHGGRRYRGELRRVGFGEGTSSRWPPTARDWHGVSGCAATAVSDAKLAGIAYIGATPLHAAAGEDLGAVGYDHRSLTVGRRKRLRGAPYEGCSMRFRHRQSLTGSNPGRSHLGERP